MNTPFAFLYTVYLHLSMAMKVSRFALVYSPPTLMVEYQDMTDDAKYVKKINIKNITRVKVRSRHT